MSSSYICFFRLDVVAGEDACAIADGAVPPLPVPLAHQDHVSLPERQVPGLRRLVGVQGHVLWRGEGHTRSVNTVLCVLSLPWPQKKNLSFKNRTMIIY